ncbi:MAG: fibronectin type III domain-containing protein [Bacteroidales bacterium]
MKRLFSGIAIFLFPFLLQAQNPPFFGLMDTVRIISGSGNNVILIPEVDDGEQTYNQIITFNVTSSNPSILSIDSVSYQAESKIALIYCKEKSTGTLTLTIEATDPDGSFSREVPIKVSLYSNHGILMSFYDIVFWQRILPDETTPSVFDTIIQQFDGPYNSVNYDNIPLTVGPAMGGPKNKYFTSTITGYLVPPVSGEYYFKLTALEPGEVHLSPNANMNNKVKILEDTWSTPDPTYGPITLTEGQVYALYAVHWIIENRGLKLQWQKPGSSIMETIPGNVMYPSYDNIRPTPPSDLKVLTRASNMLRIAWNESTDNKKVSGYSIYLNGYLINTSPVKDPFYQINGLNPETTYSIAVVANDEMGNSSMPSNILTVSTYATDASAPAPPDTVITISKTGLAIKLQWQGASDSETEVIGYNLYVNNELFNTDNLIFSDTITLKGLSPLTQYQISLEAVDASFNISSRSKAFTVATGEFDPLGPSLGETRARVKVLAENISWNEGIGLNGPYEDGSMVNTIAIRNRVKEFKAGAIRWGAISANSKGFSASTGTDKPNTYGKMLQLANEIGAYFALTVGVKDGTDYRTNRQTFTTLMEYLAGPDTTSGGAIRKAEGYSEPLLSNSKGVLIEFGNEVWGASAHDAEIGSNYTNYRNWCREMAAIIKSSPYYDSSKIILVYSGRNPHPDDSYGLNTTVLTGDTGQIECLAVSGYLGGNMNYDPNIPIGESELQYYKYRIAQVAHNIEGFQLTMKDMLKLTGGIKTFYLYESNATTPSYNARYGQALVMIDYLAESMKYGSIVPSVFHLTGGEWRITDPGQGYKPYPLFTMGKYFNTYCKGHVLKTLVETNNIIRNGDDRILNWSPIGAHAFNQGENYTLVIINRDFENEYTVQIDLPDNINTGNSATKFIFSATSFSDFNVQIDSSTISFHDSIYLKIPPFGMAMLRFTADNQDFTPLSLGYFTRIRPDSIQIYPETDSAITINKQKLFFRARVYPQNAFSTDYKMSVAENNCSAFVTVNPANIAVRGNGTCEGNGKVVLSAVALDNPQVKTFYTVNVTNQGTNCSTAISEPSAEGWFIYPNPVQEKIYVGNAGPGTTITVCDLLGRSLKKKVLTDDNSLDLHSMNPGIYLVQIESGIQKKTFKIVKEK